MSWPVLVLDWSRHQMPRPGARCIFASRQAIAVAVPGDSGLLLVTSIRRETLKACTRLRLALSLTLVLGRDGAGVRQSAEYR